MSGNARIGSSCWYRTSGSWKRGVLLHWGVHYEELNDRGVGVYTAGLVEDEDGWVFMVELINLNFASPMPPE